MCGSYVCVIWKIQVKTTLHLNQFATLRVRYTYTNIHTYRNVLLSQCHVVNMSMSMLSEETMSSRFVLQANGK